MKDKSERKKVILEYLRTIVISLLIVAVFAFSSIFIFGEYLLSKKVKKNSEQFQMEYYLVGILIEKNKYLESKNPNNYKINLKLASLYMIKPDKQKAEENYKIAIEKASYNNVETRYRLAKFYLLQDQHQNAQKVIDTLVDKDNKQLLKAKADIYNGIGDSLFYKGYYNLAILKYEKAYMYYDSIKSDKIHNTIDNMLSAYVYLSDSYVKLNNIEEAVLALRRALEIKRESLIQYKLALLLSNDEKEEANKLFEQVFKKNPEMLDSKAYYNFLLSYAQDKENQGNMPEADLYRFKAQKYKNFVANNILNHRDLHFDKIRSEIVFNEKTKEYENTLELRLTNQTDVDITNLTLQVEFRDGNEIFSSFKQEIFTPSMPLMAGEISPPIVIKGFQKYKDSNKEANMINVKIIAYKNSKYPIFLNNYSIPKK